MTTPSSKPWKMCAGGGLGLQELHLAEEIDSHTPCTQAEGDARNLGKSRLGSGSRGSLLIPEDMEGVLILGCLASTVSSQQRPGVPVWGVCDVTSRTQWLTRRVGSGRPREWRTPAPPGRGKAKGHRQECLPSSGEWELTGWLGTRMEKAARLWGQGCSGRWGQVGPGLLS